MCSSQKHSAPLEADMVHWHICLFVTLERYVAMRLSEAESAKGQSFFSPPTHCSPRAQWWLGEKRQRDSYIPSLKGGGGDRAERPLECVAQ